MVGATTANPLGESQAALFGSNKTARDGMIVRLDQAGALQNSQSPVVAEMER